ncbi:3-hydroxyacyl-CoA dehydrogenase [Stella humosa]|uniref:3-hydroxyacyl-CoA dehydrogenase n=1 Tax=Stella humosa TaxID=94 RepID=A0A3N1KKB5_9PROT|nr:3-hydroxyacyl-CoA dehydrogenase NAD-binding domain-containing protein [Stella humosa]ROP80874.1 3-hydroxyacyl-CoA dehydrogenase [Stella humosa]BBK33334.1 3-hydroxybutyryl-CoA dehydrogenase [Stella humosa]
MTEIRTVLVAGLGTMGRGIAAAFARGGHSTAILTRSPEKATGVPPSVAILGDLPATPPDLIVETIVEEMAPKIAFNARVEAAYGGRPILVTNTSGLPVQELADKLAHPGRYAALHYFQPADVIPLVELAAIRQTDPAVIEAVAAAVGRCGQRALPLGQALPGLLINRLQHAILHEAYHLIALGVCTAAEVDIAAKEMLGPRMCVTGLIEQKDLSGLDTHALAQAAIVPHLTHSAVPSPVVQDKFRAGDLGVKTGKGFYDWRGRDVPAHQARTRAKLNRILAVLAED